MGNLEQTMLSLVKGEDLENIIGRYTDENCYNFRLTKHLETWARNKEHLFKLFGNRLTVEMEVMADLPTNVIEDKLALFLSKQFSSSKYALIRCFLKGLRPEEISTNILQTDFVMFDTTFKEGIKVTKCFKQLIKSEWLEDTLKKYSMFVQSLKAKGVAVLSIDPKDYITMSQNSSGWSSCHGPDGGYRAGTVSYMMDESSVISFIKSDDVVIDETTVFSNKIWRQIVLFNKTHEYALQARQYPNEHDANNNTVSHMIRELLSKEKGIPYKTMSKHAGDVEFYGLQHSHNGYIVYYNDIVEGSFDYGYVTLPSCSSTRELLEEVQCDGAAIITVGEDVPCLCGCGDYLTRGDRYFYENEEDADDEE